MATLLNKKIAYHVLKDRTIRGSLVGLQELNKEHLLDRDLPFGKMDSDFAAALLNTQARAVYPVLSGAAVTLPAASTMDVSAFLAGVTESTGAPTLDTTVGSPTFRTLLNLGAATYSPDNKVMLRAVGPAASPDATETVKDANGAEVYGRLRKTGADWFVDFFHLVAAVETAYTIPAPIDAYVIYKHWVGLASNLLQDPGKAIIAAPGAVDVTESNNISQIALDLGIVLSNNGATSNPFGDGRSVIQRLVDHIAASADRHDTDDVDASGTVVVENLGASQTLTGTVNQVEANRVADRLAINTRVTTFFDELRSNGVVGLTAPVSVDAGLNLAVANFVAYVGGVRYVKAGNADILVGDDATTYIWVDVNGVIQTGAAFPDENTVQIAKLAKAVAAAGVVILTDEHRPLLQLDAKVYAVEAALQAHVDEDINAHAAAAVSYDPNDSDLTVGNLGVTPVANVQEAIDSVAAKLGAVHNEVQYMVLTQPDIDNATPEVVGGVPMKYIAITTTSAYEPGTNTMEVIVDGDDTDLGRVFTEPDANTVRVYFDPTEPFVVDQRIKLRWLAV